MVTPDSAVCNAERQLIICGYKPAPPRSRAPRMRKLRPGRAGLSSPRSLTQRRAVRLRDWRRSAGRRTGRGMGEDGRGKSLGWKEEGRPKRRLVIEEVNIRDFNMHKYLFFV